MSFSLGPVLIGIATIFVALTLQSLLREEGKLTPARQTWIRIALIISAIGIGLVLFQSHGG